MTALHSEDLDEGRRWRSGARPITEADGMAFVGVAADFSPQIDDEVVASGEFVALVLRREAVAAWLQFGYAGLCCSHYTLAPACWPTDSPDALERRIRRLTAEHPKLAQARLVFGRDRLEVAFERTLDDAQPGLVLIGSSKRTGRRGRLVDRLHERARAWCSVELLPAVCPDFPPPPWGSGGV